jgi:hypothetical protein
MVEEGFFGVQYKRMAETTWKMRTSDDGSRGVRDVVSGGLYRYLYVNPTPPMLYHEPEFPSGLLAFGNM